MTASLAELATTPRIAGSVLVVAAVVMFAGASIPFVTKLGGEAWYGTPTEVLVAVSESPVAWKWANGLIAVAAIGTAAGLAGINSRLVPGEGAALAGLIVFTLAAGVELVGRILLVTVTPWVAEQPSTSSIAALYDAVYQLGEGLIRAFILVAFVSLALFGIAALQANITWLGIILILFGIAGLVLEVVGAAIPALIYIGTATLGASIVLTSTQPT